MLDNNGFSQSTPFKQQVAGALRDRPEAFGIPVEEKSTTDVLEVLALAGELSDAVRTQGRPHCLLLNTYRLGPHSRGDDDRDPAEIKAAWEDDPIALTRRSLDTKRAGEIEAEVEGQVTEAKESALAAAVYEQTSER